MRMTKREEAEAEVWYLLSDIGDMSSEAERQTCAIAILDSVEVRQYFAEIMREKCTNCNGCPPCSKCGGYGYEENP